METSHGSAELLRYSGHKVSNVLQELGSNSFQLGLNVPYGQSAIPNPWTGERVAVNIYEQGKWERIDNYNFGCSWTPAAIPGMSITFGSARSGKGAGLIIPNLTNYGGNLFVNDPKGENAWITAPRRRALGHKVAILDFFGEVNRAYGAKAGVTETTTRYNPLHALDPSSLDFAEDVAAIGEALAINMTGTQNSEFFSGSGRDLIDGLVAAVVESSPPGRATLREVRRLLNLDNATFESNMKSFCEAFPNGLGAKKLRQFQEMKDTANVGIKATAKQQTTFLDSEQLLRGMEPEPGEPTFDFKELSTGALDVFLVLPASHLVTHSRLVRMMVNQAMRAVLRQRAGVKGLPVTFMLDEAGTSIGHLDTVESASGLTSGMGILVWSFYQDINQLQRDYPQSWQTFIGNSAVITVTAARDPATAKYFSEYMGNKTIRVRTDGSSSGSTLGDKSSSTSSGTSYGTSPTGRPLMMPDEIMNMSNDKMLVLYPGQGVLSRFIQWKVRYFTDARFNGRYRPDPHYQTDYPKPAPPPDLPPREGYPASYGPLKLLGNVLLGLAALLLFGVLVLHSSPVLFILVLAGGGYLKYKERHTVPGSLYVIRNGICYREGDPTGR